MEGRSHFLIVDGYPQENRDHFTHCGMTFAGKLYGNMLQYYLKEATYEIKYVSDENVKLPATKSELEAYDAILWPGCNLTIYDTKDSRVKSMHKLSQLACENKYHQFGSCWGLQLAVFIAGGKIEKNPLGREMGIARNIELTEEGKKHPMFEGRNNVFDAYSSHDDHVTELPSNVTLLAGNRFSPVQAVALETNGSVFWGCQYHPEYNLYEMSKLLLARKEKLIRFGLFQSNNDVDHMSTKYAKLHEEPTRKDLRWQLGIDDEIVEDHKRQNEFFNWLKYCNFINL